MSEAEPGFLDVARRLSDALGRRHAVVIGGICANLLGIPRLTRDVDLATDIAPEDVLRQLQEAGIGSELRRGAAGDPLPWAVQGKLDSVPFQILPAAATADPARGVELDELGLSVLPADAFIETKCRAGSWKDIYDVAWLCLRSADLGDYALGIAAKHGIRDKLATALADERLRANVAEDEP